MSLSNLAVICRPTITAWNGEVMDRVAANTLDTQQQAMHGVHKVKKVLLPGDSGTELKMLWSLMHDLRGFVYFHSLRWINNGEQLLPLPMLPTFQQGAGDREVRIKEFFDNVFLPAYPKRVAEAQSKLGKAYNVADYPGADELRRRLRIVVSNAIMPMPEHNKLQELVSVDAANYAESVLQKGIQDAMKDAYERIYEVVKHAKDKLSDKDAIFRDSLVDNMKKLAAVLPKLNVTNDPVFKECADMLADLGSYDPEELRDYGWRRSDAASKAGDLLSRMGAVLNV